MSIKVEPNHPLAEILACKLSGIQVVPQKEMAHMVNRAISAAVKWANKKEVEPEACKWSGVKGVIYISPHNDDLVITHKGLQCRPFCPICGKVITVKEKS